MYSANININNMIKALNLPGIRKQTNKNKKMN